MDCGFKVKEGCFRYRAAAVIIEDGYILMAKNDLDNYYYSVGGAVGLHETAEEAVLREVFEETGVHYEIDRLAFINESFFKDLGGDENLRCHEITFYFTMKPRGSRIISDTGTVYGGARERMFWLPVDKLDGYILFPVFFKDRLLKHDNNIVHIITEEYDRQKITEVKINEE